MAPGWRVIESDELNFIEVTFGIRMIMGYDQLSQ